MYPAARLIAAALITLHASQTLAGTSYLGSSIGIGLISLGDTLGNKEESIMPAGSLRAGIDLFKYFGIEAQLGRGLQKDEAHFPAESVDISFTHFASIYGKGILPVTKDISLYLFGGYSKVGFKAETEFSSSGDSDKDWSHGYGAIFRVNPRFSFTLDALQPQRATAIFSAGIRFDLAWPATPAN